MVRKQKFLIENQSVEVRIVSGETILEAAHRTRIELSASCGGMGTCGTCRILICEGLHWLPPPNEIEGEMIRDRGFKACERLACQNEVHPKVVVKIPSGKK